MCVFSDPKQTETTVQISFVFVVFKMTLTCERLRIIVEFLKPILLFDAEKLIYFIQQFMFSLSVFTYGLYKIKRNCL